MELEESNTKAFYEPSFLHIRINTSSAIFDLNNLLTSRDPGDTSVLSSFFHEYIHFLQEVTTVSGVYRMGLMIDLIKNVNMEILKDKQSTFKVPVKLSNAFNAVANKKLREIYLGNGDKSYEYVLYQNYWVDKVEVEDRFGNKILIPTYTVFCNGRGRGEIKFKFGHICIKEFVTYTLQKKFFSDTENFDVPYKIAGLILEKECPCFKDKDMLQVAFCDACLMDIHPAQSFFNCIEKIKKSGFLPTNCKEVYDFVYRELKFSDRKKGYNVRQEYLMGADFTKKQLQMR